MVFGRRPKEGFPGVENSVHPLKTAFHRPTRSKEHKISLLNSRTPEKANKISCLIHKSCFPRFFSIMQWRVSFRNVSSMLLWQCSSIERNIERHHRLFTLRSGNHEQKFSHKHRRAIRFVFAVFPWKDFFLFRSVCIHVLFAKHVEFIWN